MKKILLVLAISILFVSSAWSADVTLQWDANTEPDLAGYMVYYDIDSGVPYDGLTSLQGSSPIIVPVESLSDANNPEFTLNGLDDFKDHYFAVTAYDNETPALESDYSNEVGLGYRTDGPPNQPALRKAFWKIIQSIWKNFRRGLRADWS